MILREVVFEGDHIEPNRIRYRWVLARLSQSWNDSKVLTLDQYGISTTWLFALTVQSDRV